MKKLLLVGMLVLSGLTFARDFERREAKEATSFSSGSYSNKSEMSRERYLGSQERYIEFHKQLDNMDRGHEDR